PDGAQYAIRHAPASLSLIGQFGMAEDRPSCQVAAVEHRIEPGRLQQQCRDANGGAEPDWPRLLYGQRAGKCSRPYVEHLVSDCDFPCGSRCAFQLATAKPGRCLSCADHPVFDFGTTPPG